jgi:hypothetical protein
MFENNPQLVEVTAQRNSTLQGAYLVLAARALGLHCGPMSGFDDAKVDQEFLPPESRVSTAIRNSFLKGTSSRISSATLGMVIQVRCSLDFRVCHSTRRVRFYNGAYRNESRTEETASIECVRFFSILAAANRTFL